MRAAWLLTSLWLLCGACEARRPAKARPERVAPATRVHLGDWFASGAGRCRVSQAERLIAESAALPFPGARVKPDVGLLDLTFECESPPSSPARSHEVLPLDALLLLRSHDGRAHAPRPRDAEDARDHLSFELPEGTADLLPTLRRYDAATGKPSVAREKAVASLELRAASLSVDVLLRPRFHDASFDALLDALAAGLATRAPLSRLAANAGGEAALQALSKLYADVQSQFAPARFELVRSEPRGAEVLAVFALNRPRRGSAEAEVAHFELRLQKANAAGFRVAGFENREAARRALECRELEAKLEPRLSRSRARSSAEACNVLGVLIPGSCAGADAELVERALSVRTKCQALPPVKHGKLPVPPADFQLTLRRGRPESGLDKHPRFVVTLFASGQVVFHGRHWVSSKDRSDGRTARSLLAGLYAQLQQLEWFSRRASGAASAACTPNERGDAISVRANGRERMVLNREGCRSPFSELELSELTRRVEAVAAVQSFIAPPAHHADDKVTHWNVSADPE